MPPPSRIQPLRRPTLAHRLASVSRGALRKLGERGVESIYSQLFSSDAATLCGAQLNWNVRSCEYQMIQKLCRKWFMNMQIHCSAAAHAHQHRPIPREVRPRQRGEAEITENVTRVRIRVPALNFVRAAEAPVEAASAVFCSSFGPRTQTMLREQQKPKCRCVCFITRHSSRAAALASSEECVRLAHTHTPRRNMRLRDLIAIHISLRLSASANKTINRNGANFVVTLAAARLAPRLRPRIRRRTGRSFPRSSFGRNVTII